MSANCRFFGFGLLLGGHRGVYFVKCTQPVESGLVVDLCVQFEEFADRHDGWVDLESFLCLLGFLYVLFL